MSFTIGEDHLLDNRLIPYDIIGSLAHVMGLEKIGVLDSGEAHRLCDALRTIYSEWNMGRFGLGPDDEDVHTALERALTLRLGESGQKVHTGRSRNDQVLTALRLFLKLSLLDMMEKLIALARTACNEGERHLKIIMPGYTHARRAMPSTIGFWYASFADSWADALQSGMALYERLDASPLGAAAGFGVPLPLDREHTAKLMGFGRVQLNAAAVQNSRGRLEAAFMNWLLDVGRDVEKMAWDLIIYSTSEYGFVNIPEAFCTGSSIMPQKKNADVLELLRASTSVLRSCRDEIENILMKLPSGYHRDFQLTKAPLMRGIDRASAMLSITNKFLPSLEWNKDRLFKACSPEIFAAHRATALALNGTPFRKAYGQAARELHYGETSEWMCEPNKVIEGLSHQGAPGNPGLKEAGLEINVKDKWVDKKKKELQCAWEKLVAS